MLLDPLVWMRKHLLWEGEPSDDGDVGGASGGEPESEPSSGPVDHSEDIAYLKEQVEAQNTRWTQFGQQWDEFVGQFKPQTPETPVAPASEGFTSEQLKGYDPLAVEIYKGMQGLGKLESLLTQLVEYQDTMRTAARTELSQQETNRVMGQFNDYAGKALKDAGIPEGRMGQMMTQMVYQELERAYNNGTPLTRAFLDRTIKGLVGEFKPHIVRPSAPPRTPAGGGPSPDPTKPLGATERRAGVQSALQAILTGVQE